MLKDGMWRQGLRRLNEEVEWSGNVEIIGIVSSETVLIFFEKT